MRLVRLEGTHSRVHYINPEFVVSVDPIPARCTEDRGEKPLCSVIIATPGQGLSRRIIVEGHGCDIVEALQEVVV